MEKQLPSFSSIKPNALEERIVLTQPPSRTVLPPKLSGLAKISVILVSVDFIAMIFTSRVITTFYTDPLYHPFCANARAFRAYAQKCKNKRAKFHSRACAPGAKNCCKPVPNYGRIYALVVIIFRKGGFVHDA